MVQRGIAPSTTLREAAAEVATGTTLAQPLPQVSGHPPVREPAYRAYRPELQGLRALAVILVICYHVWLDRISGGVDVFFVITGFLIVGQLHRASTRSGIRFGPMWGRIIKRLFPAALTVLVGVMVACYLWLPQHRWFSTIEHVFASALYIENWQLAAESTDYFAQQSSASLLQHFWSLSIQGQFYLLMPIVVALVALVTRKAGWGLRSSLLLILATLFAGSLAFSVWLTATNQPLAYFHSLTRVWEFMLGGLLALSINHVVLPRGLRILLGWLGVAGLVSCGLLLQVGTVFPGYAALWPTMAAVLVLLAGATESRLGADRWLSSRPLEFLGNISYSLYLWHWPVLLMYLTVRHQEAVGIRGGAVIIAASLVLATATYYLVEEPARKSSFGLKRTWGGYAFGAVLLVPVLLLAQGWQLHSERLANAGAVAADDPNFPGAMAIDGGGADLAAYDAEPAPSLINLPYEWSKFSDRECEMSPRGHEMKICKTTNGATAMKRIVIVGDSHAQLYTAALDPLVKSNDWQAYSILRGGCPFSTESELIKESQACVDYNAALIEELKEIDPDAVVTMATYQVGNGRTERTPAGFVAQWRKLESAGIPVVAFRDNPRYDFEPSACADDLGPHSPRCSGVRAELYPEVPPYERMPDLPGNVRFVDLSDYFCDGPTCPPIIGNVRVYMDDNHITKTYMNTLAPVVERELRTALSW